MSEDKIKVNYFGHRFYVHSYEKYIAMDGDGSIYSYKEKPFIVEGASEWSYSKGGYEEIYLIDINGVDWRKSLMFVDDIKIEDSCESNINNLDKLDEIYQQMAILRPYIKNVHKGKAVYHTVQKLVLELIIEASK